MSGILYSPEVHLKHLPSRNLVFMMIPKIKQPVFTAVSLRSLSVNVIG